MHENSFQIGRAAEAAAADFLVSSGYRILARNLAWRGGEIDLVAWREGVLVFVEVKFRSRPRWDPVFALDRRKRARIVRVARWALARHPEWLSWSEEVRFDLVVLVPGCAPKHVTDVFAL